MKPSTAFTNSACRDTLAAPGLALAGTGALAMSATPSDMLANYSAQAGGAALAERGQQLFTTRHGCEQRLQLCGLPPGRRTGPVQRTRCSHSPVRTS